MNEATDVNSFVKSQLKRYQNAERRHVAGPEPSSQSGRHPPSSREQQQQQPRSLSVPGTTIELSVKQLSSPVYLFVRLVAGKMGENRLDTLFDLHMLAKMRPDMDLALSVVSPVFMTGVMDAKAHLSMLCRKHALRLSDDESDIITDMDHPLFVPFASLVAIFILDNQLRRPSNLTSVRGKTQFKQGLIQELRLFETTLLEHYH